MKNKIFSGVGTALVTPFRNGKIDFHALEGLIEMQIKSGVDALVICGTTGECATLSDSERYALYEATSAMVGGRVKLIFGTGTNDTAVMIRHSKMAEKYSPDGLLVVTPYYNKGTDDGIIKHYESLINQVDLPIIVYNVPSRTGVNLSLSVLERLMKHDKIVGIKEAGDSASRYTSLSRYVDDLPLYAGNDNLFLQTLSLGGCGVISVLSNALPKAVKEVYESFCRGDIRGARDKQIELLPMIDALFYETNPAPIKWLLYKIGLITDEIRLPLTTPSERCREIIESAYGAYKNQ